MGVSESVIDVIGVGARGVNELPEALYQLVKAAEVVIGSERLLADLPSRDGQETLRWPSPLRPQLDEFLSQIRGRSAVVLASGDPLVSGIAATLIDHLGLDRVRVHPAVSSVALARARLGWSDESSQVLTLVGRRFDRLRLHLAPGARLIVLSHGSDGPARLAAILTEEGYANSAVSVLGDLGSGDESRADFVAGDWPAEYAAPRLHLCGIDVRLADDGVPLSRVPGLPDASYENDGQLTKQLVRAATLSHLAPMPGQMLWDLGAGAGSVGIEWCRQDPSNKCVSVERDAVRADRVRRNADRLGVPDLRVVEAAVDDALPDLPPADAVFIGGGATEDIIAEAWSLLPRHGRIVVSAVTLEAEELLHRMWREYGGTLVRLGVEELTPLGRLHGWAPSRAITQWVAVKSLPNDLLGKGEST